MKLFELAQEEYKLHTKFDDKKNMGKTYQKTLLVQSMLLNEHCHLESGKKNMLDKRIFLSRFRFN